MNGLRGLRKDAGLTLRELAEEIGVHQNSLARYQNGHRMPQRPVRKMIAHVLGITEEDVERALQEGA